MSQEAKPYKASEIAKYFKFHSNQKILDAFPPVCPKHDPDEEYLVDAN